MRIGQVFRDAQPEQPNVPFLGGHPNLHFLTKALDGTTIPFNAGINTIKLVHGPNARRPAVIIRSSPHKAGSDITPWQDRFDPNRGHVRYYGDNKYAVAQKAAHEARGNRELLDLLQQQRHPDPIVRLKAAPLIFFETVPVGGKQKGHVRFQGYGLITTAEVVTQLDPETRLPFPNILFQCVILSLANENEQFDWSWINLRRDPKVSDAACLEAAPKAWRTWALDGQRAISRVQRRVATLQTVPTIAQKPAAGSKESRILAQVYDFYQGSKSRFEACAELVTERVLSGSGARYRRGWITRASSDKGVDFVGRLDVGDGFSTARIVILGQAKCEKIEAPTGGVHIARTVARLRRGWIGVYVTTSFFSPSVQEEIFEDRYPIVLIHGLRIAQELDALVLERGLAKVDHLLNELNDTYESRLDNRDAEEILLDL